MAIVILLHMQKHALESQRGCMDGPLLDHFQQVVVILYDYLSAIDMGMRLLEAKAH